MVENNQEHEPNQIKTGGGAHIKGSVDTGGGDFIGRDKYEFFTVIQQFIRQPAAWQDALWFAFKNYWPGLALLIVLEIGLLVIYRHYHNLYLIEVGYWLLASVLLAFTTISWYFYTRGRGQLKLVTLVILSTFSLMIVLGWQTWRILLPSKFDPQTYGIALAELGEGFDFDRTKVSREISGQIYEHICRGIIGSEVDITKDSCITRSPGSDSAPVEIKRIGILPNTQTALELGEQVKADIVVWGQLLTTEEGKATIRFQFIETPDRAVNPNFPLVLPVTSTTSEISANELDLESRPTVLKRIITHQSQLISSFSLGLISYLNREYVEAARYFESIALMNYDESQINISDDGRALIFFYLGRVNHALGNIEEGQEWLIKAKDFNPDEPAIPLGLALGYRSLGKEEEADLNTSESLDLLDKWIENYPNDKVARYDRGVLFQITQRYKDAAIDFNTVIELDPNFYIAYLSLGQVYYQDMRLDESVEIIEEAISISENNDTNPSWAYLNLAIAHGLAGDITVANDAYVNAINYDPDVDWMYFYYGKFLEQNGQMDAALENFQSMIGKARNKGWAYSNMAGFLRRRGLFENALEYYKLSVREQNDNALLHTYLAETYLELGEIDSALTEFQYAINLNDDIYYVYASYAGVLVSFGDYASAENMYERAVEIQSTDYRVLLNLGQIYEIRGSYDKAEDIYRLLIEQSNGFPEEAATIAQERLATLQLTNQ